MTSVKINLPLSRLTGKFNLLFIACTCKVCFVERAKSFFECKLPPPAGSREGHRMMISQTGDGKPQGAELVPHAERVRAHIGRPEQ
nr:MAG TPA: hypothetical protein [Caudoviricetes sp.]